MDDLLDLDWSSSPSKPKPPAPRISQPNLPTPSFDFLAKPTPSLKQSANYYSSTPSLRPTTPDAPLLSPQPASAKPPMLPRLAVSGTATPSSNPSPILSADAFSSLLSLPSDPVIAGPSKGTSLAERQKQLAEEKRRQAEHERQQFAAHGAFWDNLGGQAGSPAKTNASLARKTAGPNDLLQYVQTARPSSAKPAEIIVPASASKGREQSGSFWDDDDFLVTRSASAGPSSSSRDPPSPSRRLVKSKPLAEPHNFDAFSSDVNGLNRKREGKSPDGLGGMRTPESDFEFGDGGNVVDDDYDLLGELGKPAGPKARVSVRPLSPRQRSPAREPRTASPPPHIIGQIVEMGFSPAQARQALAKTQTGVDVEAAVESLLGGSSSRRDADSGELDDGRVEGERQRREEEDKERRRRRRQGPTRDSVQARAKEDMRDDRSGAATPDQFADQADKLYAQASEIGQSVLSKASLFWNSSKEKALKVYEEQKRALEAAEAAKTRKPVGTGRPKWMAESAEDESDVPPMREKVARGGFRADERSPSGRAQNGFEPKLRNGRAQDIPRERPRQPQGDGDRYMSVKERADLLFAEEPKSYRPANRHRKPVDTAQLAPPPAFRTPSPVILPSRQLVHASTPQLQASVANKAKGNDHFKLGRFAEAEAAYSSAIASLPEGHLFLVSLHNNRAAARLKLGESGGAAEDCTTVIDLIGPGYHPNKEAPLPTGMAAEVKLADAMVKATIKRAQAWEMGEKWTKAVEDWESVMGFDGVMLASAATATRSLAAEGARRARRMREGKDKSATSLRPTANGLFTPRPAPQANVKAADVNTSEAVAELRKAAQATEAEDAQRLELKDSVDARLIAWRGGKETNLRALIASLDTVLWDGILSGGLKVGMHELIQEKQVKLKYMKVIGRLHPDKLNVSNTTVEQKMLANGAFGTLNEAWRAFNDT